jgi:hypothetical protein
MQGLTLLPGLPRSQNYCQIHTLTILNYFPISSRVKIISRVSQSSICRTYNPVLSSFMTYHLVCNKNNTTDVACCSIYSFLCNVTRSLLVLFLLAIALSVILWFISVISWQSFLLVEETIKLWPAASHWQTLLRSVVSILHLTMNRVQTMFKELQ